TPGGKVFKIQGTSSYILQNFKSVSVKRDSEYIPGAEVFQIRSKANLVIHANFQNYVSARGKQVLWDTTGDEVNQIVNVCNDALSVNNLISNICVLFY
ncbi:hypothetical protein C0J52_15733, partial [Blattella germanica]